MLHKRHNEEDVLRLYLADYRQELFLREISRGSGLPVKTAQRILNKLLENNILQSRETGKHKYFLINFDNPLAKAYLLRTELASLISLLEEDFLLKKVYGEIIASGNPGAVALFGSYARRKHDSKSDIDLLYIGDDSVAFIRGMKELESVYGKPINVKKSTRTSFENALKAKDVMVREVLKNHILLSGQSAFVDAVWSYFHEIK